MMSMLSCTVVISELLTLSLYAYRCYGVDFFLWEARSSVDFLKLIASPSCQWLKDGKEVEDVLWMHLYSPLLQLFICFICLWRNDVARRCSVAQACLTFCDPMDARLPCPSLSPGIAQTHVHWVGDAIQPSCPLSSASPPTFSLSQHQGLFQWVISSHQVAQVLELQLQYQSFQWIFRTDFL